MQWFVEEKTFSGGWSPAVYHCKEAPNAKTADYTRVFREPPVEIKGEHHRLDFNDKVRLYGADFRDPAKRLHLSMPN